MANSDNSPKPIITGCGVLKKIRSDSPRNERRHKNHAAPAPKNNHAARFDRGKLRAADPMAELFQSSSPPVRVRNNPGKRVAMKRLMELIVQRQWDERRKSN